ncbi:hypothetical protein C5167_023364 [Papaver somniferum]|uniref:Uncharacterized protein n=1 Tax=Papaver somniferum TaxID=3469 RepID=A0A4Y7JM13_PAPSO|nr:hypothetical protein C5167_023364 [Papaver somniferum]
MAIMQNVGKHIRKLVTVGFISCTDRTL